LAETQEVIDRLKQSNQVLGSYQLQAEGLHLFVMSHGFQGNSNDLRGLKNQIAHLFPDSLFLMATSNEGKTDGDILEMGDRLA